MRKLRPLGAPRGPRGIEDDRRLVGHRVGQLFDRLAAGEERREVEAAGGCGGVRGVGLGDDEVLASLGAVEAGLGLLAETFPRDERDRVRIGQVVGDLVGRQEHVERHHRAAQVMRCEIGDGELRHIRQHERDVLAALDAELGHAAGELLGIAVQRLVGERGRPDDERGLLGIDRRAVAQQGGKVQ